MKPLYATNYKQDMLVACGWQYAEYLPSNAYIRHRLGGGEAAGCLPTKPPPGKKSDPYSGPGGCGAGCGGCGG